MFAINSTTSCSEDLVFEHRLVDICPDHFHPFHTRILILLAHCWDEYSGPQKAGNFLVGNRLSASQRGLQSVELLTPSVNNDWHL